MFKWPSLEPYRGNMGGHDHQMALDGRLHAQDWGCLGPYRAGFGPTGGRIGLQMTPVAPFLELQGQYWGWRGPYRAGFGPTGGRIGVLQAQFGRI